MRIFVDESGNTGLDLLSVEQPLFCLASTSIDDATAFSLLQPLLRQGQVEAKYSTLKRSDAGKQALIDFFNSPEICQETVNLELVHKRFALCAQIVDKLIEPATHDQGIDLYEKGLNIWTSNLLFYTGQYTYPDGLWDQFLAAFVHAHRTNTHVAYIELENILDRCRASPNQGWERNADLLSLACGRCKESLSVFENRAVFDPSSDLFMKLVQHWMGKSAGTLDIYHDSSKPMARLASYLRTLMTPIAPRTVGQGERQAEFPLRVNELNLVNSRDHPSVQLADIFAGAAIDCMRSIGGDRTATDYHYEIADIIQNGIFSGGIMPSPPDELGLNDELTGPSVLDGVNEFLAEVRRSNRS